MNRVQIIQMKKNLLLFKHLQFNTLLDRRDVEDKLFQVPQSFWLSYEYNFLFVIVLYKFWLYFPLSLQLFLLWEQT